MVRAPAMAPESAAFWHWLRDTAIMPMSMASATMPNRAIRHSAIIGSIIPRRRQACTRYIMMTFPSLVWCQDGAASVGLAAHQRPGRDVDGVVQEHERRQ